MPADVSKTLDDKREQLSVNRLLGNHQEQDQISRG